MSIMMGFNLFGADPTKWLNTLKHFVRFYYQIVWVCLTILRGCRLKDRDVS